MSDYVLILEDYADSTTCIENIYNIQEKYSSKVLLLPNGTHPN
jgi:hypothetical protein